MPLEPAQKDWLLKLDSKAVAQEKLEEREDLKRTALFQAFRDRTRSEDEILEGTDQMVVKKGSKKTQKTLDRIGRRTTKEFDLDEQRKGFVLATTKMVKGKRKVTGQDEWNKETGEQVQFEKMQDAGRIVDHLALQLQQEVDEIDEDGNPVYEVEMETEKDGRVKKDDKGKPIPKKGPGGQPVQKLDSKGKPVPKKVPLFTDDEIKEELYNPMRRTGVIPETNIPDKFSATKEMIDGSFEGYANRLSQEKKKGIFAENLNLGIAVFRGCLSFTTAGEGLAAASKLPDSQLQWTPATSAGLHGLHQSVGVEQNDPGALEETANLADQVAVGSVYAGNLSDIIFDVGKEGKEAISEKREEAQGEKQAKKEDAAKLENAAGKIAGVLIAEVSTAIGNALNQYGLGMSASSSYGALIKGGPIAKKLKEKDVQGAADLLKDGISQMLLTLDPKQGTSTAEITKAANAAKAEFKINAGEIAKNLEPGKYDKVATAFGDAANKAAKFLENDNAIRLVFSETANNKKAQANASKAVCEEFEREETAKPTPKQVQEHSKKNHEPQWVETQHGFKCMSCLSDEGNVEMFAGILERKIKKLEDDAAIMKWITTIGGLAFDVASNFVAPLAMGGGLLRMAKNANEAIKRWSDFIAFTERQGAMIRAASSFSSPVDQFIHNATQQHMHYTLNAAMEGMKVLGAALQLGLLTAPVGVGISGGAVATQAIEGIIYEAKKRYDLETAWTTYKDALENPDNRKLALKAMEANPTLAKYAMAWGAVIKKDPLVGDFMNACGLNESALKDPEANVANVVRYLEKRMPDDNVVVGRKFDKVNQVDLTPKAWIKIRADAEKNLKLKKQDTSEIESLLAQWQREYGIQKKTDERDEEGLDHCLNILKRLGNAFAAFKPFTDKSEPVPEMSDVRAKYYKTIGVFTEEVQGWVKETQKAQGVGA